MEKQEAFPKFGTLTEGENIWKKKWKRGKYKKNPERNKGGDCD